MMMKSKLMYVFTSLLITLMACRYFPVAPSRSADDVLKSNQHKQTK